ncbi:Gfo/Idh/MocA family oxidoreductase, partial [Paenarthrobacter sp. CM16]|uniref:Gfo/Idh/MocA family protein n=1 Tax=Paenarthrobacter sp. CM16 TaxID=2738447 RepID=UPI0015540ACD
MPTAAVIGCGDISTVHFEALSALENAELVAVCDTDPERLAAAAAAHGVPGYADYLDMLQEVRPDVVHVCTPHHLHASVAADCLERGVNVIVEKPLAHTLEEGQRLIEVAERSPARIGVCFQNRYNATSQAMHELLDGGTLGQVVGASATVMWHRDGSYYRNRPWRGTWAEGGGGLMMNQAIHTVDLLQWLVGDVAKVEGRASTRSLGGVIEVEDTAEFVAEHVNGARSVFYATLANAVNAPVTLDIVTEKATLSLRGDLTVSYADGTVEVIQERVAETGGRSYWGVSHQLLIADFYATLGEPGQFWINPAEAAKS